MFEESIKSENTRKAYIWYLQKFVLIILSYCCLLGDVRLDTPHKLEIHLQIEHKWKQKKEAPKGFDNWT